MGRWASFALGHTACEFAFVVLVASHSFRILAPQPGIEPGPTVVKAPILPTGPPGNSLELVFGCDQE